MNRALLSDLSDWRLEIDIEGIAWATFDRQGESANALGRRPLEELMRIVERIEQGARDHEVKGLVIVSGKEKGFIVGADIREFDLLTTEASVIEAIRPVNAMLDRIEKMPVPVVAAVHGVCVGGGLELILACHYRIATRDEQTRFGFPEVKLGIFPGFNGTARSIRQTGPQDAMDAMLTGRMISATSARAKGFIDQLVDSAGTLHWAARRAVLERRHAKPAPAAKMLLARWPARSFVAGKMRDLVKREAREAHYPAPYRLIDLFESHGGGYDAMKAHETRAFAPLMVSDTARNLRRVFRLSEALKAQAPKDLGWKPRRVHVIGAGTMGADIAGVAVAAGMEVTLQDLSPEVIQKGIAAQGKLFARRFKTKPLRDAAKARLIADPEGRGLALADVVIEAIVERLDVKQTLFRDIEAKVKPDCVLATNTSSLRIEEIASGMANPSRLVGIHFFNPVAKMPLVEVVRGEASDPAMIDRASAFVVALAKFPLVVKSVPGFLVNRVLAPYMLAAMKRADAGEDIQKIDEAARAFGMPVGPIELADTVGLDVCAHVGKILGLEGEGAGGRLERLVSAGKLGKKSGEGFYVWKDGKPELKLETYNEADLERLGREIVEPLIREARRALDDGVVANADLVDAGMIFGTGFAPFRGGPLHYASERGGPHGERMAAAQ
ncbi:MAG: enoyl-CoA hydratase/isomerase family protein [Hyphomicrobiaceae bacterium]|nr:enoyl-CoA hydratase/isomerase family protein [Hyphomicrobiaceae bacterium]